LFTKKPTKTLQIKSISKLNPQDQYRGLFSLA